MTQDPTQQERQDALIVFTPSGKRGHVPLGTKILDAARMIGVDLDSVCGGRGICSKCQIAPSFGRFDKLAINSREDALSPRNEVEEKYDRLRGLEAGRRLGCQTEILGDIVIDVPPESQLHSQIIRKSADDHHIELDPLIRVATIELAPASFDDPRGEAQRLRRALEEIAIPTRPLGLAQLAMLQSAMQKGGEINVITRQNAPDMNAEILAIAQGEFRARICGVAIDIGSTTIAAHLCDLQNGDLLASAGRMNPQIRFGEDLMSRVSYAMMNADGARVMSAALREGLDAIIGELAENAGLSREDIYDLTLVGNPVMHHLALGLDPTPLGQAPFALATDEAVDIAAAEIGIHANPEARAHFLPLIAGHVGADAAAMCYAIAPHLLEEMTLICDIGTNAEIVLGNKDGLYACSSPTGPAFEGAQISHGQRAAPGAIERARIDKKTGRVRFSVIGDEKWSDEPGFDAEVTGICGSGIIELVAEMRLAGVIDAGGLIGRAEGFAPEQFVENGRTIDFVIHDGRANGGRLITVTNKDVREIQLAKAALYAGARLLMEYAGVAALDRVVLAGAFGAHISPEHALILGMIPDCDPAQVTSAGNAAGTGARIALLNRAAREEVKEMVRKIEKIETAMEAGFQAHFVAATNIPHASDEFAKMRSAFDLPSPDFKTKDTGRRRKRRRGKAGGS